MINLVELIADPDEHKPAPCRWGNIIIGHACYCHNPDTPYRKCGVWSSYGEEPADWGKDKCEWFEEARDG